MVSTLPPRGPVMAEAEDRPALAGLVALLEELDSRGVMLVAADGRQVKLPASVALLLRHVVHELARERVVTIDSLPNELTTQQAAEFLDVPRSYLTQLVDERRIPSHRTGSQRTIRVEDLVAYKTRRDAERREALDELARQGQEIEPLLR